jgi:sugar/nucleoside kinase (ribokinase family)
VGLDTLIVGLAVFGVVSVRVVDTPVLTGRGSRAGRRRATAGAAGAYLLDDPSGMATHVVAAPLPRPVIDSNGAGDAFVSGFLYGHLRGLPPRE